MKRSEFRKNFFKLMIILILILSIFNPQIHNFNFNPNKTEILRVSSGFQWNITILNDGEDEARDICLDHNGDMIITGKIYNSSKNANDVAIIKYDNSGNIEWNKTWGGNTDDSGLSITVDTSNNIYITGYTTSFGNGSYDICLLKYSSSGTLIWNKTWGGIDSDKGYGVQIDNSNNVFVCGSTNITSNYDDVVLLKYNGNSGNLISSITWGEYYDDCAYDMIISVTGNVYLTGYTDNFGAIIRNMFLIKFNNSLELVYNKTWGDDRWHEGRSLNLDSDESILITGFIQNYDGNGDFILLKVNSSTGNIEWSRYWGGDEHDYAYGVALDSKENIYLVGSTESYEGAHKKACIVKFNKTGHYVWIKTFSKDFEGVAYALDIDLSENLYITGKTKLSEIDYNIFLLSDSPKPWIFDLISDATSPDIDGNFNLTWSESLDAKNYSLYQSNEPIDEINVNVTEIVIGNTNGSYLISNLEEGNYYFKVIALNEYGNRSSPQLEIIISYSPGSFELYDLVPDISTIGKVLLTWSESLGADNYSIYVNNVFINSLTNKGTLIEEGLDNISYQIPSIFSDGLYYFAIVSHNEAGETLSNCINLYIQKVPCFFTLNKELDSGNFDKDGNIFLSWTKSDYSKNYVIYRSLTNITNINDDSVIVAANFTPDFEWPNYRYPVSISVSGNYYFLIIAYNDYGNYSSECIQVEIRISEAPTQPEEFPLALIIIIIGIIAGGSVLAVFFYIKIMPKLKKEVIKNEE